MPEQKFGDLAKSFSVRFLPHSEVELSGEVPAEAVNQYREAALSYIAQELELPGFRKGRVPHDLVLKKVGELGVLEEAVERFMREFYPVLVQTYALNVVGRPAIRITKLAAGNPVGLSMRVATYPDITLPKNWKSIAAAVPSEKAAEVTDEEVGQTIESLRQSRAKPSEILDTEGKPLPPALPELTDEFAQSLGAFKTVEELKAQIRKGIDEEKGRTARDARRGKIIDALLANVEVDIPTVFVESELDKILSQMREDVSRFGMSFEEYLKRTNKTEEGVHEEFRSQAQKRAKLQLTLNKLAQEANVEVDSVAVEHEAKHAREHFPDANPELLHIHIETVLRNEKVLQLLESE